MNEILYVMNVQVLHYATLTNITKQNETILIYVESLVWKRAKGGPCVLNQL